MNDVTVLIVKEEKYFENLMEGNYIVASYSDESDKDPNTFETSALKLNDKAYKIVSKNAAIAFLKSQMKVFEDKMTQYQFNKNALLSGLCYSSSMDPYYETQIRYINNQIKRNMDEVENIKLAIIKICARVEAFEKDKAKGL